MGKFTKQNGITLIALIITIIVMLILVAVTISVALNGGIFNNAKDAKTKTNLAKEKEILQTTALGYLDNNGDVDLAEFVNNKNPLEGYTLTNNTTYVTASNGANTFYITKQGGLTEVEPSSGESIYEVAYVDTWDDDGTIYNDVIIIKNNKMYFLYYDENYTNIVDDSEIEDITFAEKENDDSEVINIIENCYELSEVQKINKEVILENGNVYGVFIVKDGKTILCCRKTPYIENKTFAISSIDLDNI